MKLRSGFDASRAESLWLSVSSHSFGGYAARGEASSFLNAERKA